MESLRDLGIEGIIWIIKNYTSGGISGIGVSFSSKFRDLSTRGFLQST